MTKALLNIDQSPQELQELYRDKDYYWYLRSPEFGKAFLAPLGEIIGRLGVSCLDVGCGEGQLASYLPDGIWYVGIDGSTAAIERAKERYLERYLEIATAEFRVGRFEDLSTFTSTIFPEQFSTLVFGNLLSVLIKPDKRLDFVSNYVDWFSPTHFVVYDLEILDVSSLLKGYQVVEEYHYTCKPLPIDAVKLQRKILVFQCQ